MKSAVVVLLVAVVGTTLAAPSPSLGLGVGLGVGLGHAHAVPLDTRSLVVGPSGVISSHQSNGVVAVAPAVIGVHSLGLVGHNGIGLGAGLGGGLGVHGW